MDRIGLFAGYCGGCAHRTQIAVRGAQPSFQTADQAGHIGPLGAIIGMQLVQHQKAQRFGAVPGPQALVFRAQQQEVEHLIVRQEDIRRVITDGIPVFNQVAITHRLILLPLAAHIKAGRDRPPQAFILVDHTPQAG